MKKILYLLLSVPLFAIVSCDREEEDIFNASTEARMAEAIAGFKSILSEGTGEWLVNYYPEANHAIGGYALYCKFAPDGSVQVASEVETNAEALELASSTWEIVSYQGAVLSFDTYNPVMHYFSEPYQNDVTGRGGDYEFVLMRTAQAQDSVYVKGVKGGNRMVFQKIPGGISGMDYLAQTAQLANDISYARNFRFMLNGAEIGTATFSTATSNSLRNRSFTLNYPAGGKDTTLTLYYTFTPTGIDLYEAATVNDVTVKSLTWNDAEKTFSSAGFVLLNTDEKPVLYEDFLGKYTMSYSTDYDDPELTESLEVELVQDIPGSTYFLKGILTEETVGNIVVEYEPGGGLSLRGQILSTYDNGDLLWWLPFSQGNTVSRTTTYGLTLSGLDRTDGQFKFSMVDNGAWASVMAGFIIRRYTPAPDNANAGNINGIDGQPRYYYLTFEKIR
ncbi:MAG: DUF4302 domain-containing protein [Tannerella sp.]|jgi:hypothetical protein|nr:DUF4302 domain-containing protein [Tannerella sp.]